MHGRNGKNAEKNGRGEAMKERVIYYSDLLNDDFAGTNITPIDINSDFTYINKNPLWRLASFILYYFIAFPLLSLYCIFYLHLRVKNRKVLRKLRKTGFFIYANHTGLYDAFTHSIINFPKKSYVIANRDAVSIRGLKQIVLMLGALPIPNNLKAMKNFAEAVETHWRKKKVITIYPEAHVWPYYNKIRPFPANSFRYPVKLNSPVICMVTTYRQRKIFKKRRPYATIYLSEPFYPNTDLSLKEAMQDLRDRVYNWMENCIGTNGSYEYIRYIYRPKE